MCQVFLFRINVHYWFLYHLSCLVAFEGWNCDVSLNINASNCLGRSWICNTMRWNHVSCHNTKQRDGGSHYSRQRGSLTSFPVKNIINPLSLYAGIVFFVALLMSKLILKCVKAFEGIRHNLHLIREEKKCFKKKKSELFSILMNFWPNILIAN